MNLGKMIGSLAGKVNVQDLGGALLSGLTRQAVEPTVTKWWKGLPDAEKRRQCLEVRDLAGDMQNSVAWDVADLEKRREQLKKNLADTEAQITRGGKPAQDAEKYSAEVGDSIADIIGEITDGTDA